MSAPTTTPMPASVNGAAQLVAVGPSREEIAACYRPLRQTAFKVQAIGPKAVQIAHYIDARAASRVLDEVFAGDWHARNLNITESHGEAVVQLALTVRGATRDGVGSGRDAKAAASDALKRGAVLFGVGAYLYALPRTFLAKAGPHVRLVERDGKTRAYITEAGERELRKAFERWLEGPGRRFGEPRDLGVLEDAIGHELDEAPTAQEETSETAGSWLSGPQTPTTNGARAQRRPTREKDGQVPSCERPAAPTRRRQLVHLAERAGLGRERVDVLHTLVGCRRRDRVTAGQADRLIALLEAAILGDVDSDRLGRAIERAAGYQDGAERLERFVVTSPGPDAAKAPANGGDQGNEAQS